MKYFSASFYYVRYSILGKIIRETYRQFKWRVWLFSILFIFLFFLNQFIHLIFRLLDEIFYHNHHKLQIKQPVFIISNPRSGTTYLHRLISLDEDRFSYTKYAHTFQMTASFARFAKLLKRLDNHIGSPMRKSIDRLDHKFWGAWDDIHAMGFNKAEEDELIFAQMLMSTGIFLPFPYFDLIDDNKFLDYEPESVQKNVMDFYESCIKRFMYASGSNKTYLAKNVMSSGRFKTLIGRFPDAKIIYINRHPYDSLPSCASMFSSMYGMLVPGMKDDSPPKKAWVRLAIDFFKYSQQLKKSMPASQLFEVQYNDLLANPQETVLNIYRYFNWEPQPNFLAKLSKEEARNRNYKSAHEYSLEQYGFSKQEVYAELGSLMDELGFDKEF